MPLSLDHSIKNASILIGAFLCLCVTSCKKSHSTPTWESSPSSHAKVTKEHPESSTSQTTTSPASAKQPHSDKQKNVSNTTSKPIRFIAYNLQNYLTIRRYNDGHPTETYKPEEEIRVLIRLISQAHPDILGVCEIGRDKDLKNLQSRLKKVGVNLPYTHRVYGSDLARSLAILSRFPILSKSKPKDLSYSLHGIPFQMSRGILDVTLQLPHQQVRFLGVHLKSKRPVREADQAMMRRHESILLKKHIDSILTKNPSTKLLVYGDFNDTKRSQTIETIRGYHRSKNHLYPIELKDSRGETWTHYWKFEDLYSRIDFVFVSKSLTPWIDQKKSTIIDTDIHQQASDHRPLLILIKNQ